jgi:hypothetical protein
MAFNLAFKGLTCLQSRLNYQMSLRNEDRIPKLICAQDNLTFWRRNYFILILAHPVYKM